MAVEFKGRIAGRFYLEFFFYLAVFAVFAYFALQPHRNPWLIVSAVVSGVLFLEMLYLILSNSQSAEESRVRLDKNEIFVGDRKTNDKIRWKEVDLVQIAWVSEDKWLEALLGLDPSILIKRKRAKAFEVVISPDFFDTSKVLAEMEKLHPDKIFLVQPVQEVQLSLKPALA